MLPDVIQLLDHHGVGVGLAARVGETSEGRDDGIVVVAEVAAGQDRGAVDRHWLHHDHPRPAECPLPVVADVAIAR